MTSSAEIQNIVVFGGTGAQGKNVVKHLASTQLYKITVPTRNPKSPSAQSLLSHQNTHLLQASYTTNAGLRASFKNQHGAFFNMNSFALRESDELYWTIRAYEIAIQEGVKHFVFSGAPARYAGHGYKEEFRNAHNAVGGHLTSWLEAQPTTLMGWTTINGGVYIEMLGSLLRPIKMEDGLHVFAAPIGNGSVPLALLDDYGALVKWIFQNPEKSIGKRIEGAPFVTTWPELATSFTQATGKKAVSKDVTQDEWFSKISAYVDPESRMPKGASEDDEIATTFRKSFGAWWNLWKYNKRDLEKEEEQRKFLEDVNPGRPGSVMEWMRRTGYDGEYREALKAVEDGEQGDRKSAA